MDLLLWGRGSWFVIRWIAGFGLVFVLVGEWLQGEERGGFRT